MPKLMEPVLNVSFMLLPQIQCPAPVSQTEAIFLYQCNACTKFRHTIEQSVLEMTEYTVVVLRWNETAVRSGRQTK